MRPVSRFRQQAQVQLALDFRARLDVDLGRGRPSGPVCLVFRRCPSMPAAADTTSSGDLASLTPPALPRPPACTCALTTHTEPPRRLAARAASSGWRRPAPGHRDPVAGKELLRLVFVQIHAGSQAAGRSRVLWTNRPVGAKRVSSHGMTRAYTARTSTLAFEGTHGREQLASGISDESFASPVMRARWIHGPEVQHGPSASPGTGCESLSTFPLTNLADCRLRYLELPSGLRLTPTPVFDVLLQCGSQLASNVQGNGFLTRKTRDRGTGRGS